MTTSGGKAVIGQDLFIKGEVRNGREVEIHGTVHGSVAAEHVVVHPGGRVVGVLDAGSADIHGHMDGRVRVRNLISIAAGGAVHGDVRYGRLALAAGGDLAAEVRNIPPDLLGDFEVVVRRGRSVRVTSADLTAVDPDDTPDHLTYHVSNVTHGYLARAGALKQAIVTFLESELAGGLVYFVHDGLSADTAGFDVAVSDPSGGTSGDPRRVTVVVIEA